jgi:iron complex transport system substrate-binding protein
MASKGMNDFLSARCRSLFRPLRLYRSLNFSLSFGLIFSLCISALTATRANAAETPQAQDLPRIVSLNMCADPYLMAFADAGQISALSSLSQIETLSPFHQAARAYSVTDGGIEDILARQPDVVIVSPYSSPMKQALLTANGIRIVTLAASQNFAAAGEEILALGRAIGRGAEAAAYWHALQEAYQRAQRPARGLRILALQRRGLSAAPGHVLGEIITSAGGQLSAPSHAPAQALVAIGLEQAIAMPADALLVAAPIGMPRDRGDEYLSHPALAAKFPESQRLYLPANLTHCTGAATPLAIEHLAKALEGLDKLAP